MVVVGWRELDKIERQTEGLGDNLDLGGKKGEVC